MSGVIEGVGVVPGQPIEVLTKNGTMTFADKWIQLEKNVILSGDTQTQTDKYGICSLEY